MPAGMGLPAAEARRRTVEGNPEVARLDENYRTTAATLDDARWYVGDAGLTDQPDLWAIVAMPRAGSAASPRYRRRRRSIDDLSPSQRKRYLGSKQAQEEARAYGMTIENWYEQAPDLKAFRGHAPERRRRPDELEGQWLRRLEDWRPFDYRVYISRDSEMLRKGRRPSRSSAKTRAAWRRVQRKKAAARQRQEEQQLTPLSELFEELRDELDEARDNLGL